MSEYSCKSQPRPHLLLLPHAYCCRFVEVQGLQVRLVLRYGSLPSCVSHAHLLAQLQCMSKCVFRLCRAAVAKHICQHNYIVRQNSCSNCAELRQPCAPASIFTLYVEVCVMTEQSCGSQAHQPAQIHCTSKCVF